MYRSWGELLDDIWKFPVNQLNRKKLLAEKEKYKVFPKDFFRCFQLCPFEKVKVIILSHAPYGYGAVDDGLAYSCKHPTKIPLALKAITEEVVRSKEADEDDMFYTRLDHWAEQGVLLLNTMLTYREGQNTSHEELWKNVTLSIIQFLATIRRPIVWMLWGDMTRYKNLINVVENFHLVLEAPNPRMQKDFIGNDHFKKANEFLKENKEIPIDWATSDLPF